MIAQKTLKLVTTSVMAALCCIATMLIQIPSPVNGYVHLGDAFVILSGLLLGPCYGGLAGGIGSMLADILTGYAYYAPGTFVIKLLAAMAAGFIFHAVLKNKMNVAIRSIISGIPAGIIVVLGYFLFASIFLGKGIAAAASITGNIAQVVVGITLSTILITILIQIPQFKNMYQFKVND